MNTIQMTSHTIVEKIYLELKNRVKELSDRGIVPALAVILVGHDPQSELYVASIKQRRASELGIDFKIHRLDENVDQESLTKAITDLNNQSEVNGIIVQLPLPSNLNTDAILNSIDPGKDVDGLHQDSPYLSPTVSAILELIEGYDLTLADKKIVIVGKGRLVGAPLLKELQKLKLQVEAVDDQVEDLAKITVQADILVSATGKPNLIQPQMVKEGAVVIDVDQDVNYEAVGPKTAYITPQRGGVGPLTVAFLLQNVIEATLAQATTDSPQGPNEHE